MTDAYKPKLDLRADLVEEIDHASEVYYWRGVWGRVPANEALTAIIGTPDCYHSNWFIVGTRVYIGPPSKGK